jgi:hypothetical protein
MKPFSFFKLATDEFWIPFRVDSDVKDFSHNGYTELIFQNPPIQLKVLRAFYRIYNNDNANGLKLVRSMWRRLNAERREIFFRTFKIFLRKKIDEYSKGTYINRITNAQEIGFLAEIYLEELNQLWNLERIPKEESMDTELLLMELKKRFPLKWKKINEKGKAVDHVKDFLAWASIPFEVKKGLIEETEKAKKDYFSILGSLVDVSVPAQPLSNISSSKRIGTFGDIGKEFYDVCLGYKSRKW